MDRFVYDPIEHYIFKKEMNRYGYDLSAMYVANLENILRLKDLEGPKPPELLVALYFGHALELGSERELVVQLAQLFEERGWSAGLKTARQLVRLVKTKEPTTPQKAIELFIDCLNAIFERRATFAVKEWTTGTKGNHKYREVVISVAR